MHGDLNEWLEQVWDKRPELIKASTDQGFMRGRGASAGTMDNSAIKRIYAMYNSSQNGAASYNESHLSEMKKWLVDLESATTMTPGIQNGLEVNKMPRGWMGDVDPVDLKGKFIHYSTGRRIASNYRIYINCKSSVCGEVFKKILVDYNLFNKVDGLSSAKLAAPGDIVRADAIVIYVGSSSDCSEALNCIENYHQTAPGNFGKALPKLVTPARELQGVGTAMEPPSLRIVSTGGAFYKMDTQKVKQSFGSYRSELIFMALERTRYPLSSQSDEQRKQAFKNRVEKYFRHAGIDPDNPALQGEVGALRSLSSIKNWSAKTDKGD